MPNPAAPGGGNLNPQPVWPFWFSPLHNPDAVAGGVTQTFTFTTTDGDLVVFSLAGMTDQFSFATTDVDTVSFQVGAIRNLIFTTQDLDAVSFSLAGMTDTFAVASSDTDTVSFGVSSVPPAGGAVPSRPLVGVGL